MKCCICVSGLVPCLILTPALLLYIQIQGGSITGIAKKNSPVNVYARTVLIHSIRDISTTADHGSNMSKEPFDCIMVSKQLLHGESF